MWLLTRTRYPAGRSTATAVDPVFWHPVLRGIAEVYSADDAAERVVRHIADA